MMHASPTAAADLWRDVDGLLDRTDLAGVHAHGLLPLAARRLRELGREVPSGALQKERAARTAMLVAPTILGRARDAYDGAFVVIKGPEVAALYPGNARSFTDIDLLADDAHATRRALLAGGFAEVPDPTNHYRGIHHLVPLVWPGLPLEVEIHEVPKWPKGLTPPPPREVLDAAVPARCAPGVQAPAPHHHALILAAHAWAHTPLRSARDLIDVAATAAAADPGEIDRAARRWGADRMWTTTRTAYEWLLGGAPRPAAVSLWARHLIDMREATVLEGHAERWLSPFWLLPPRAALPTAARRFAHDFEPGEGERWGAKAGRLGRAARHAFMAKSEHGWANEDAPPPVELPRPTRD